MNIMKSKAGFTLVELIVVIAILGILAGIAIPAYSGYIKKAESAGDTQVLSAIHTAASSAAITEGNITNITVAVSDKNVSTVTVKTEKVTAGYIYTYTAKNGSTPASWTCSVADHGNGKCPVSDFSSYIGTEPLKLTKGYTWSAGAWS